ncbi:MAG: type I restriction endonuclease, partial [Lachnospiraceae bacterium]
MLQKIEAVIFDLDGSLVDSMWLWPAVDEEYMNKYALTMPEQFHEKIEGMSFTETARFLEEFPDLHQSIEQVQTEWLDMTLEKYTTQVTLKPGALEFITELKKRGIAIREAFNQVHRYSKESFNSENSLYKYLQLFVISNGTDSRYFANT